MTASVRLAPGGPGRQPRWTSGAKAGVGTAVGSECRVWFTLGQGVLNEIFYPLVDCASVRELQLLVADGREFFSEEKHDTRSETRYLAEGVPAFHLNNTCKQGRYRIEKTVLADPRRSVVLQQIRFVPLQGKLMDYAVFAVLAPHLGNQGAGNTAWVGDYKGEPMLFAQRAGLTVALASSAPWGQRSAGFVGSSDGWQDIRRHKQMTWIYDRAENGNVALTGQVYLAAGDGSFVLALAFGRDEGEAGLQARTSLLHGFEAAEKSYIQGWTEWQQTLQSLPSPKMQKRDLYHISAAVMRAHESKEFPGATVASLATPWGRIQGDDEQGYHVVWPRDMIETVGGHLALGAHEDARRILRYLGATQEADGHWPQNMFLNGTPNGDGIQLDETALVIVLVGLARREKAIHEGDIARLWPMVRKAAGYLVRHGPVTPMDRWEEDAGYFASTMAVEIAALLTAAELAESQGETALATYLRETADAWNAAIEGLIYVTGTDLARRARVDGYYARFAGPGQRAADTAAAGEVTLKNHPKGSGRMRLTDLVSVDALMLVRFGLRAADDPRILNTVKVLDLLLKVETPHGPCWHRYNEDGYGEHADGSPFDGTGIGRVWPLLAGERGHYEVAAGNRHCAERLINAMESFANECGLLPEQVWDSQEFPERNLFPGRPSGSAMPLVWAHAEYVKLRRSVHEGRVFDMPAPTMQRYLVKNTGSPHMFWRTDQPCRTLPAGKILRLELFAPSVVRWSTGQGASEERPTHDTGLGVHLLDLPTGNLTRGSQIDFTFRGVADDRWAEKEYQVVVEN